jgi:hypothetical protein
MIGLFSGARNILLRSPSIMPRLGWLKNPSLSGAEPSDGGVPEPLEMSAFGTEEKIGLK